MANRSFIYSSNTIPEKEKSKKHINGVAEYRYSLPLTMMIFAGTKFVTYKPSIIWDGPEVECIVSEAKPAIELWLKFMRIYRTVIDGYIAENFDELFPPAEKFLSNVKDRYFIIEAWEVLAMDGNVAEKKALRSFMADCFHVVKTKVEPVVKDGKFGWLNKSYTSFVPKVEIDEDFYFDDVLYYSFK